MSKQKIVKKEMDLAGRKLSLETGLYAPQTNRAVFARYGDTVVLATVVANEPSMEPDFFPLRVDYEERLYAGGFIKTSRFVKREGQPSEQATIAGRLIDHAIRPLFPKDFMDEVQVVVTILSVDKESDPEILGLIAASAALTSSDVPFAGPCATVRVGLKEGNFILNPGNGDLEGSDLDIVVSVLKDRVLAMEAKVNNLPEEKIVGAVDFAIKEAQPVLKFINEFAKEVGAEKYAYAPHGLDNELIEDIRKESEETLKKMVATPLDKVDWVDAYQDLKQKVYEAFEGKYARAKMDQALNYVEKKVLRKLVLEEKKRPDGRKLAELRPIEIQLSVLPRTHGSAFFARGITQTLTTATLGATSLGQLIQNMYGEETKRYIHHYNGAPFSLGEIGPIRAPGRREIGHGVLAERALLPVIPSKEEFPYTIRVVSEILSQNGSSSMAATCGSTLALMDAGVPIKAAVGGVAIGLMTDEEEKEYVVLTDIAGIEDWNGFMDFKMTGTKEGVTAIQMDIKLAKGLPFEVFEKVVKQSHESRLEVLAKMQDAMAKPREKLSEYAPKISVIKIDPKKIGDVIGPGGKIIKKIIEESGAEIDIDDDGTVFICCKSPEGMDMARKRVDELTKEVVAGETYEGKVTRIMDFGAFVELWPGKEGLVHVSEMAFGFVNDPRDVVSEGKVVKVKVTEIDAMGRVNLSMKALLTRPEGAHFDERPPRSPRFSPRGGAGGEAGPPRSPRPWGERRSHDRDHGPRRPMGGFGDYRTPNYRKPDYPRRSYS